MTTPSKALWAALLLGAVGIAAYFVYNAYQTPLDSPLARMYRTEASLTALEKALRVYQAELGALPHEGGAGLRAAAKRLSAQADYFPRGPVHDAWGNAFVYAPKGGGAYRLHSRGADAQDATRDDITSWEPDKPWRPVYKELQRAYKREG
jgi:hypothetical protein